MTLRVATRRAVLYPATVAAAASGWWLGEGTIDASDVLWYGEDVSPGTVNGLGVITGDWTYAVYFTPPVLSTATTIVDTSTTNSLDYWARMRTVTDDSWIISPTEGSFSFPVKFTIGVAATWFVIADETGGTMYHYIDNTVGGDNATISSAGQWDANNEIVHSDWTENVSKVALYSIALDATQRTGLQNSMTA